MEQKSFQIEYEVKNKQIRKISIVESWTPYAEGGNIITLRDGGKIRERKVIILYHNFNPQFEVTETILVMGRAVITLFGSVSSLG